MPTFPRFNLPNFLNSHIQSTIGVYHPNLPLTLTVDSFKFFKDNGDITTPILVTLFCSTRFIFNMPKAYQAERATHSKTNNT